jgi:hypothetical protein
VDWWNERGGFVFFVFVSSSLMRVAGRHGGQPSIKLREGWWCDGGLCEGGLCEGAVGWWLGGVVEGEL